MATAQSSSSSSGQKEAAATPSGGGLRTQLRNMLPIPKRAVFHVRLTLHQLSALPVESGAFAVKWKLKHVVGDAVPKRSRNAPRSSKDGLPPSPSPLVTTFSGDSQDPSSISSSSKGKERAREDDVPPSPLVESANPSETALPGDAADNIEYTKDSRGSTHFARLRDFNVVWEYILDTAVEMHIDRESSELQPNQLKLTIVQQGMPKAPVGTVLLNLAEYADAGSVTRQHLLRGQKTNATLKVTLHVEYKTGEKHYRPPPLRKSEILAGISGLLSTMLSEFDDLHVPGGNTNAFPGQGVLPYVEDWTFHPVRPPFDKARKSSPNLSSSPGSMRSLGGSTIFNENTIHAADTERVIEGIFNPFSSTSTVPNPFTYYAPAKALSSRSKPSPSSSNKDLLTVPVQSNMVSGNTSSLGTQECPTNPQGMPHNRRSSRDSGSARGSSRPESHSGKLEPRKSIDQDARSVTFSIHAGDSVEGSVDSHHSQGSKNSGSDHHGSPSKSKKPGWFKRLLSSNSSSRSGSADTILASSNGSRADLSGEDADDTPPASRPRTPDARMRSYTPEALGNGRHHAPEQDKPNAVGHLRMTDSPKSSSLNLQDSELAFVDLHTRLTPKSNADATLRASRPRHSNDHEYVNVPS